MNKGQNARMAGLAKMEYWQVVERGQDIAFFILVVNYFMFLKQYEDFKSAIWFGVAVPQ